MRIETLSERIANAENKIVKKQRTILLHYQKTVSQNTKTTYPVHFSEDKWFLFLLFYLPVRYFDLPFAGFGNSWIMGDDYNGLTFIIERFEKPHNFS